MELKSVVSVATHLIINMKRIMRIEFGRGKSGHIAVQTDHKKEQVKQVTELTEDEENYLNEIVDDLLRKDGLEGVVMKTAIQARWKSFTAYHGRWWSL
jgi:hypothetical protein